MTLKQVLICLSKKNIQVSTALVLMRVRKILITNRINLILVLFRSQGTKYRQVGKKPIFWVKK